VEHLVPCLSVTNPEAPVRTGLSWYRMDGGEGLCPQRLHHNFPAVVDLREGNGNFTDIFLARFLNLKC
jgi:hypothetical protein